MYGFVRLCPDNKNVETPELTQAQSTALAARIREELARRRMSRAGLADAAKISLSTLEKTLNGSRAFTLSTIVRLEGALGISLRAETPEAGGEARADLGGYARAGVAWLERDWLTLRPSLEVQGAIYAYRTRIGWDGGAGALTFQESGRMDAPFAQKGVVSLPAKSGHIYLHTNDAGQMRLAVLGRPLITGEIYGVLTTLQSGPGTQLVPVSMPLALIPLTGEPRLGRITAADAEYAAWQAHLARVVDQGFARMVLP